MSYSTGWATISPDPCRVVLDTNVVLDWLLFCDPRCARLSAALASGRIELVTDDPCLAELKDVLSRPKVCKEPARAAQIVARYTAQARPIDVELSPAHRVVAHYTAQARPIDVELSPAHRVPAARLPQCRDPSDQKFLELASRSGAHLLITRDRELLVLAKPSWSVISLSIVNLDKASAGINELMARAAFPAAT